MGFTDGNDGDNEVLDLMVVLEGGCLVSQCGLCLVSNRDTVLRFSWSLMSKMIVFYLFPYLWSDATLIQVT